MKKISIIKLNIIFAILIVLVSCSDDFLDLKPQSDVVSGSFTSAQDAENLLTGAYSTIGAYYQYNRYYLTEGISDNHYVNGDNPTEMTFENFSFDAATGVLQEAYVALYNQIAAANTVLDNVSVIEDSKWDGTTRKEQILGEASFLRAISYYELVTQWGGVPIFTSLLNDGNLYPERNTEAEVYDQIITDLIYAENVLLTTPYENEFGRATKGSAQALLAKTYAQIGDYNNCLTYANKVIESGVYSLVSDFSNVWGMANKNNTESIFDVQQGGTTGWWGFQIFAYAAGDGWPKRQICSADLVRAFQTAGDTIGSRYTTTFNWQIANASFNMPVNAWDPEQEIPFQGKYAPGGWFSQDNIRIIRLADIILLAAEANVQLNNLSAATILLNQIRSRAGLDSTSASSKSELALAVLNERRLELVFECTRWNDLKRADASGVVSVVDVINEQLDSNGKSLGYTMDDDKHQLIYPIPNQDRLLNKNLTQNPGY
ncbi:RagB/SusD family nutrient uptake outer membrane protein [uncultured Draconibacterium sp.]|uniref:RagB/SusD family nutrient uptake outer membrane protein n=1 Tax=uncultured Draconibacterium sp. TaxID=1573823 RepID=UPI002AA96325|nr:RagB/SusD family nutrient uptake outer membrane protein [uncultured Draconibacterium sp.]